MEDDLKFVGSSYAAQIQTDRHQNMYNSMANAIYFQDPKYDDGNMRPEMSANITITRLNEGGG